MENSSIKSVAMINDSLKINYGLQHMFSIRHKDQISQKKWEMFLSTLTAAENSCPLSSDYLISLLNKIEKSFKKPTNRKEYIALLTELEISQKCISLIEIIFDLATVDTVVTIHASSNQNNLIEIVNGHRFELKRLLPIKGTYKFKDVKVVCIDGYIENVSELHMLFTELSETKSNCLLVCRGMSNDVLHTIQVNNDRSTLSVRPYVSPFDLENVNSIVDIAKISGTDVVSSTKGDLISSTNLSKSGNLSEINEFNDFILIKSKLYVSSHIATIKKMREERPDIQHLLDKRLRSLTSSCIKVHLVDDVNINDTRRQIDLGIRIMSALSRDKFDPITVSMKYYEKYLEMSDNLFTEFDQSGNLQEGDKHE